MLQYWYDAAQIFTVMSNVPILRNFETQSHELKKLNEYEKCPDDSHKSYENVWHC